MADFLRNDEKYFLQSQDQIQSQNIKLSELIESKKLDRDRKFFPQLEVVLEQIIQDRQQNEFHFQKLNKINSEKHRKNEFILS